MARDALRSLPAELAEFVTVELLVSELVANSVQHASLAPGEAIELVIVDAGVHLRVEVRDPGRGYQDAHAGWTRMLQTSVGPEQQRAGGSGGYGLSLVSRGADRSGVDWDDGTVVWFEIDSERSTGRDRQRDRQQDRQRHTDHMQISQEPMR